MFVAKFSQVPADSQHFKADKHEVMPYIGEVLSGSYKGSIMNGTMFQREGNETGVLYVCENFVDDEYPDNTQTRIISKCSIIEFMSLRKELGAPKNLRKANSVESEPASTLEAAE